MKSVNGTLLIALSLFVLWIGVTGRFPKLMEAIGIVRGSPNPAPNPTPKPTPGSGTGSGIDESYQGLFSSLGFAPVNAGGVAVTQPAASPAQSNAQAITQNALAPYLLWQLK